MLILRRGIVLVLCGIWKACVRVAVRGGSFLFYNLPGRGTVVWLFRGWEWGEYECGSSSCALYLVVWRGTGDISIFNQPMNLFGF